GRGGFLFQRFFRWYGPFFRAYSFVHARSQEYEADRRAADLVGAKHKAEALIWLNVNSLLLSKQFWPDFRRQSLTLQEPPENVVSQLLETLQTGTTPETHQRLLALRLARQTNNASTHPCLSDRLEALAYSLPDVLEAPHERATVWLGNQLNDLTVQLNQHWQTEEAEDWRERYDRTYHQLDYLERLNAKADQALTVEEKVKQATMTWRLRDPEAALPMFQAIAQTHPHHTAARYWLGYLLLEQSQDDTGVAHLKFALDRDPSLRIPACRQLYSFYLKQDQPALAKPYKEQWQQHEKVWNLAQTERSKFDANTQFIPHDLPTAEIQQLAEYFSICPDVKAVYLVRKVVERFAEYPYYVIAIARRYYRGMGREYRADSKLKPFLESAIALSQAYTLIFLTKAEQWPRLRKVKDALIYHNPS
ncbi:MAG: M48 family metalloprotease, partial [Cyanobacteria bacterium P01_F01_bin.86]